MIKLTPHETRAQFRTWIAIDLAGVIWSAAFSFIAALEHNGYLLALFAVSVLIWFVNLWLDLSKGYKEKSADESRV